MVWGGVRFWSGYGRGWVVKKVWEGGTAWYEGEVHPRVVSEIMGEMIRMRSYEMPPQLYEKWVDKTGMGCVYGGVVWRYGRVDTVDEWGRKIYRKGVAELGDDVEFQGYCMHHLPVWKRRLEEMRFLASKMGKWLEWNVYMPSMTAIDALGMEKWMMGIGEAPGAMKEWVDELSFAYRKELNLLCEDSCPEIVKLTQIFQNKSGWMYGEDWRNFELKFLKEAVDFLHKKGKKVSLHCDGVNDEFYGILVDYGVDIIRGYNSWNTDFRKEHSESNWEMDYKKWGQKIVFNGIMSVDEFERNSAEQVRGDVIRRKGFGRQIIGLGECTGNGVSTENFKAMMETAK
jgi:hypothetical protein